MEQGVQTAEPQPGAPAFRTRRFALAWSAVLAGLLVLGPIAGWIMAQLRGADGGTAATLLLSQRPAYGLMAGCGVGLLTLAVIAFGARTASVNVGLVSGGLVLAWAAARSGRVDELLISADAPPWRMLAIEGMAGLFFTACVCWAVWHAAPDSRTRAQRSGREPGRMLAALAVGAIAGCVAAWMVAVEPAKGQVLAAAAAAGIAIAVAARMVCVGVPRLVMLWVPAGLAVVVPLGTSFLADPDGSLGGAMLRLSSLTPLDWLAGAMLGIPVGAAWTESVVEQASD